MFTLPYTLSSRPERSGAEGPAVSFSHGSLRSAQVGFISSMSHIFFSRLHRLMLFSFNRVKNILITFKPNQPVASIRIGETGDHALAMLLNPMPDVVCHSAIENVRPASDDVHVVVMIPFTHTFTITGLGRAGMRARAAKS
jgi:hypothetical protein